MTRFFSGIDERVCLVASIIHLLSSLNSLSPLWANDALGIDERVCLAAIYFLSSFSL